jgi:hypothetical protein
MPFHRLFVRSPSPERRQTTIASIRTRLSFRANQPGPRPRYAVERRQEPTGSRQMVGGMNEATVGAIFQTYRQQFRDHLHIIGDDTHQVNRRCAYTREHKLSAINYALNTWQFVQHTGQLEHITRYYGSQKLGVDRALLTPWIKNKQNIFYQKRGARRLRGSKIGRELVMERKLNMEFERLGELGDITHHWFTR